jgi:hypothetical protein
MTVNDWLLIVTVNVRESLLVLSSTRKLADTVPLPDPGDTLPQVPSVRAVHAQPAPVVTVNAYEAPLASTDPGKLVAAMLHPAGAGDGAGDGDGAGLGLGLGLGDGPVTLAESGEDPHPAMAIASTHGAQRSSNLMMRVLQQSPRQRTSVGASRASARGQVTRVVAVGGRIQPARGAGMCS